MKINISKEDVDELVAKWLKPEFDAVYDYKGQTDERMKWLQDNPIRTKEQEDFFRDL